MPKPRTASRHPRLQKITDEQVRVQLERYERGEATIKDLAAEYGMRSQPLTDRFNRIRMERKANAY
jgi:hypothetical protein